MGHLESMCGGAKMRTHFIFRAIVLCILFAPLVLAGEVVDQQQTSGGSPYQFYFDSSSHRFAKQSFLPTKEKITKVALGLFLDNGGYACNHYQGESSRETFDVSIEDASGSAYADYFDYKICQNGIPTRTGWENSGRTDFTEVVLTQSRDLVPGQTYWIRVRYDGVLRPGQPLFFWDRSSSDAYARGSSVTDDGSSNNDFVFKTWAFVPERTCREERTCDGNDYVSVRTDCSQTVLETCGGDTVCEFGGCAYRYPKMSITNFAVRNETRGEQYTYLQNERIRFVTSLSNINRRAGSYTYTVEYHIQKNGVTVSSYTDTRTTTTDPGDVSEWTFVLPQDWSGEYSVTVDLPTMCDASVGTCHTEKTFTVNMPCIDTDGDGYHTNCGISDCDDTNAAINPGRNETCGDGRDENCVGGIDENCCSIGWVCSNAYTRAYRAVDCSFSSTIPCGTNGLCTNGNCGCSQDYQDCDASLTNGCEVNLLTDRAHCGRCGNPCQTYEVCSAGGCVLSTGSCRNNADCTNGRTCESNQCNGPHFVIEGAPTPEIRTSALATLENAYTQFTELFGQSWSTPITVNFMPNDPHDRTVFIDDTWVAEGPWALMSPFNSFTFYYPSDYATKLTQNSTKFYNDVRFMLAHRFTHLLLTKIGTGEGLATAEGLADWVAYSLLNITSSSYSPIYSLSSCGGRPFLDLFTNDGNSYADETESQFSRSAAFDLYKDLFDQDIMKLQDYRNEFNRCGNKHCALETISLQKTGQLQSFSEMISQRYPCPKYISMEPTLFWNISTILISEGMVNDVFYANQSENEAADSLRKTMALFKLCSGNISSISSCVGTVNFYSELWSQPNIIKRIVDYSKEAQIGGIDILNKLKLLSGDRVYSLVEGEGGDAIVVLHSRNNLVTFEYLEQNGIFKYLDYANRALPLVDLYIAFDYGLNMANGSGSRFIAYMGEGVIENMISPVTITRDILGIANVTTIHLFIYDIDVVAIADPINGLIDGFRSWVHNDLVPSAIGGGDRVWNCFVSETGFRPFECVGDTIDSSIYYWRALSSPYARINNFTINPVTPTSGSEITFEAEIENAHQLVGGEVWLTLEVRDRFNLTVWSTAEHVTLRSALLDLFNQRMTTRAWSWTIPHGRNRYEATLTTRVACGADAPNDCLFYVEQKTIPIDLTENHPPQFNATYPIVLNPYFEGQAVRIVTRAFDPDYDTLSFFITSRGKPWSGEDCPDGNVNCMAFVWSTQQGDAGRYNFTICLSDGEFTDICSDALVEVLSNRPTLVSPLNRTVTQTQTPTFIWSRIVGDAQYVLNVYRKNTNNRIYTDTISPSQCTTQCTYTLENSLAKDTLYEWEIIAQHTSGENLRSERQWFMVDCYTNTQCGINAWLNTPVCNGNNLFQPFITFTCNNPGELTSYCSDTTASLLKERCANGCIDGRCRQGCASNDPQCDTRHDCVDNKCVLKSGCTYNNPSCSKGTRCFNNQCVPLCRGDILRENQQKQLGCTDYSVTVNDITNYTASLAISRQGTTFKKVTMTVGDNVRQRLPVPPSKLPQFGTFGVRNQFMNLTFQMCDINAQNTRIMVNTTLTPDGCRQRQQQIRAWR